jgi:isoamyl acetate esterase
MHINKVGSRVMMTAFHYSSPPPPPSFRIRPSILCFGDSITQYGYGTIESDHIGWISLLSSAYTRRCDVLNRGYSGYNTRDAIQILPYIFRNPWNNHHHPPSIQTTDHQPIEETQQQQPPPQQSVVDDIHESTIQFCTIFFGANDATLPGSDQHVPIEEYGQNIDFMIREIRNVCGRIHPSSSSSSTTTTTTTSTFPIILMTPPPIDEEAWAACRNIEISDRTNENALRYGIKLKEIATKHDHCEVLDTWELLEGQSSRAIRTKHLCDGLHLNQSGNRLVFDGLLNHIIRPKYPHLAPMDDNDGKGKYGTKGGIPVEGKLWTDFYPNSSV